MDTLTAAERSERMSRIRGKDTAPEITVRRLVHSIGYRYRLHATKLPGRPDLVFGARRKVIFVHGCFWHCHDSPLRKLTRLPKARLKFWRAKLEGNRERDLRNQELLRAAGWNCLVLWECELGDAMALRRKVKSFLG